MEEFVLGTMEKRFADLIWDRAPVTTAELVKQCDMAFGWKRTTTYTMLKRLCQRDLFKMEHSIVTVLVPREEFLSNRSRNFVNETFGGSLPAFIATFTRNRSLSREDADALQKLIDESRKEGSV